ncbi:DEAD/DEAH box helicase [Photobacterium sanguinicancri]|uniref:Diguanylate cyclase n=1 Tax=Photobacterium sanguinicancri TaxID=875932 RepID=A0ABX4FVA8_9GAMM|nr:DEAD/DEAH box helicase family protein [Photobacterium sanguinicancri]OZS42676.1 diguanylate cyclase [Photobacterium sanguinicancri]
MKLRNWQVECLELALSHYRGVSKNFLCLATPGAGKTIMAAEVAARLYEEDKIDFILCFSPSVSISESIQTTFTRRFNQRFDGVIGAAGCSYTYQNMLFFKDDFWQLLRNNRVFVIFDEIHHCAGTTLENANVWGEEILLNIKSLATYTLSLTGTPWRSDKAPIVLSEYSEPDNKIRCDYIYGLKEAVSDNVCRRPKIVLLDNEKILVTDEGNQIDTFGSIIELLKESAVTYQSLLTNDKAIRHILSLGCKKLKDIRRQNPTSGGLVVASSVKHALEILYILRNEFHQSAVIATYQEDSPNMVIDEFRHSETEWIVSVGMVSEGTDIPRLQVCCHLSRVKTELYFRQVLGRILRVSDAPNQEAWLFTFAEYQLTTFANRISYDLPDMPVIIKESECAEEPPKVPEKKASLTTVTGLVDLTYEESPQDPTMIQQYEVDEGIISLEETVNRTFELLGVFRERVIATFDSPF